MRQVDAIVCSPPYAETTLTGGGTSDGQGYTQGERCFNEYGHAEGQIGALKSGTTEAVMPDSETEYMTWSACYDDSWKDLIVDEAFAHPAKFSPGLIDRIYRHGLAEGWFAKGDLIGDPFGGIGGGGIYAAYKGLRWVGVELEPKFVELFGKNVALHSRRWENGGLPIPQIVQGDSREFAKLVGECGAIVTSPPFSTPSNQPSGQGQGVRSDYAAGKRTADSPEQDYGQTPGQIGNLKADGIVTSPPYEGTTISTVGNYKGPNALPANCGDLNAAAGGTPGVNYADSEGQLGNTSGESYWQAMDAVYRQCLLAIKPSGVMAVVVKDYVKNKARVPLCDQTADLLTHIGFEPVQRVRAWLVKETRHPGLFDGEVIEKKERKSFFRRLAEKKGSPRIDWEEVIVVRAPGATA